eukprot:jgi/Tetstr1/460803/TSEL_000559.t1
MDSPLVLLHPAPTAALLASRRGKPTLNIAVNLDEDVLCQRPAAQDADSTFDAGGGSQQPNAGPEQSGGVDAMECDAEFSPCISVTHSNSSAATVDYPHIEAGSNSCQLRAPVPIEDPASADEGAGTPTTLTPAHKRQRRDKPDVQPTTADTRATTSSNIDYASGEASGFTPGAAARLQVRVAAWTRGVVCTPPPCIDQEFGDFPLSALSNFSDSATCADLDRPSASYASDDSACTREELPSPKSAVVEYFRHTSIPRDGWMQTCRGCGTWTGASTEVHSADIPCCRRCQQRCDRLKSKPYLIEGKKDPLSLYIYKTLEDAGLFDPTEDQMPAVLEKALEDLHVTWSDYLASE